MVGWCSVTSSHKAGKLEKVLLRVCEVAPLLPVAVIAGQVSPLTGFTALASLTTVHGHVPCILGALPVFRPGGTPLMCILAETRVVVLLGRFGEAPGPKGH